MSGMEETYGSLLFLRKTGEPGTTYPLASGKTCIGSSVDADIRLKLKDERLEEIHCIIEVADNGIATIVNKSHVVPVCVNTISVTKFKVLSNNDEIDLIGKKFQYVNVNITEEDVEKHHVLLSKIIDTPLKRRQSFAAIINTQSTKETTNFKTKTPVKRKLLARKSFGGNKTPAERKPVTRKSFNGNRRDLVTPEREFDGTGVSERPKTTSKLIVSKALSSPRRAKKRRLSMDDYPRIRGRSLKVSERNIQLSENVISSTISEEEEPVPSKHQRNVDDNDVAADFLDVSNRSLSTTENGKEEEIVKPRLSMRTPSRTSTRIVVTEPTPVKTPKFKTALTAAKTPNAKTPKEKSVVRGVKAKTPRNSIVANKIQSKTPSTPVEVKKMATPASKKSNLLKNKVKNTPNNTPRIKGVELLKGTPSSAKKSTPASKTVRSARKTGNKIEDFVGIEETPRNSNIGLKTEATPSKTLSTSKSRPEISNSVKTRQRSVGTIAPPDKSASKRRKTEGSQPIGDNFNQSTAKNVRERLWTSKSRKSNITSTDSEDVSEGMEILNMSDTSSSPIARKGLSSTDSDVFEEQISKDPRISLGKASPRKSIRKSLQTVQHSKLSFGRKHPSDEEEEFSSEHSLQEETETNGLDDSKQRWSTRRQTTSSQKEQSLSEVFNLSQQNEEQTEQNHSKSEDSKVNSISRTSVSRRYFRKSNTNREDKETDTESSDSPLPSLQDQSLVSFTSSSISLNLSHSPLPNKSLRRSDQTRTESKLSTPDIRPIFVPQRRPSLKRSYLDEYKELCVNLSRSTTLHGESTGQRSSLRRSTKTEGDADLSNHSILNRENSIRVSLNKRTGTSPALTPIQHRRSIRESSVSVFSQSASSEDESILSSDDQSEKFTPKSKKSFSMNETHSEEELSDVEYLNSSTNYKRLLSKSNTSVITLDDDSIKGTPENNTSIVILDTPLEKPRRKKLSKTLNCSIEECIELTTPKSAIKGRRSKSLPYKPIVEEITPVTPQESSSRNESGFKTPINTPGLFENIKNSVLKSRSRRRPSSHLMEELNKAEVNKAVKRARESTESVDRLPKKRKMLANSTTDSIIDFDASFASFATDEIFTTDTPDQYIALNTPHDFRNLTDKPLITDPQAKSLTEPRKRRLAPNRLSLHAMRLESQLSSSDSTTISRSSSSFSNVTDSSGGSRRSRRLSLKAQRDELHNESQKTFSSDTSSEKLFGTPKEVKSPKNDLTDIRGVRRLLQMPRPAPSPKNNLSNVAGVKKLLSTPNIAKSPANDLTRVPNLRKLVYPTQQNSPKNDLSNVAGVKKLLGTPRQVKSPRNDLRNVPNLRNIMSPKQQNSPKNDLSDVAGLKKLLTTPKKQKEPKNDLTNVAGVKKLLSTPKTQNSPLNDLTKVPNLRKIMSPKQQNSPWNDLSNVSGVADVFTETELHNNGSDIENNEDLFNKLFVQKPIRTYRGKSLSPITRKAMLFGGDQRKTLGDTPYSSPRLEKWLEDQAVVGMGRAEDAEKSNVEQINEANKSFKATPRAGRKVTEDKSQSEKKLKGRPRTRQLETVENLIVESPRSLRNRQGNSSLTTDYIDSNNIASELLEDQAVVRLERVEDAEKSNVEQINEANKSLKATPRAGKKVAEDKSQSEKKLRGRPKTRHLETVENLIVESPKSLKKRQRNASPMIDDINNTNTASELLDDQAVVRLQRVEDGEKSNVEQINKANNSLMGTPRGGRKDTEDKSQSEKKLRGRPKTRQLETVENLIVESPRSLRTRQRNASPMTNNIDSTSTTSELQPKKRGRVRKVSQKEDVVQQVPEVHSTTEDVIDEVETETTSLKKLRGRKQTVSCDTVLDSSAHKSGSRKRNIPKKYEDENTETKVTPVPKRGRGRPRSISLSVENSQEEEKEDVELTVNKEEPKRRGRKAVPASKTRKGNRKKTVVEDSEEGAQEKDEDIMEETAVKKKEPKRRNRAPEPTPVEEVPEQTRRLRRKKIVIDEDDAVVEVVNEVKESKKKETKRRNVPDPTPEKTKRQRGKKVAFKENNEVSEEENQENEANASKKKESKRNVVSNPTSDPVRRQRGRKIVVEEDNESSEEKNKENETNASKKKESMRNVVPNPTSDLPKRQRGRKIVIEEDGEVPEEENKENIQENVGKRKGTKSTKKTTTPVPEEADVSKDNKEEGLGNSKRGRKPAKTRGQEITAEETPEDSPRTRQKKGNFKKYGSEFVTELGSFEENKTDEKKKRKGKVDEQVDEVENLLRRSKRTRK